ncbi:MAG TPA: WD40 repeat domain-containing protein, partial [Thermoanaerobaculia bacterium]|nr:WD40 repeat domain-containing protein [Thermoanaerobaculia bacterium]
PGWEEKTAALGLSPNGRWLAAAADGTGSRLWDLSAGGDLSPPIELGGGGGPVAFSPDNRWLVTMGGEDEPARLWDLTRPDPRAGPHRLEQARGPVAWSADRRWLVTAGADRSVRLWRLGAQGASAPLTLPPQENRDTVLAVSPDSRWLVTSSWDPEPHGGATDAARLWDLAAEHPELTGRELPGNTSSISHVAFSPDGHWLATGSAEYDRHTFRQDHTVYLWDLTKKASTAAPVRLQGHEGSITAMAISPDSRWLATGSGDKTARLWDLTAADPAAEPLVFGGHENRVTGVAFGPDSRWLVTLTGPPQWHDSLVPYTPMARLWDLREESPAPRAAVFEDHGRAVAVSTFKLGPGGRFLALVAGSTAYVLDLSSNRPAESARVLRGHEGEVTAAAFGQEGRVLVTASLDSTLRLWHLTTVQPAASPLVVSAGEDELFAVSPDNRWLVTLDGNDAVLWDLRARDIVARPVFLHGHEGPVFDAAFSPDSRWLATGSSDQTARLWRLDGKPPGATSLVLRGHTGVVDRVAFSRDGRRLATGSFDETVRLWDLTRSDRPPGSQVLQADGPVFRLAFSADGRRLLASGSGAPRLWDLTARDPRASPRSLPDGDQAALLSPDSHWLVTFGNDAKRALRKTIDHTQDERQRFELEKRWQGMAATTTLWDLTAEPAPARRVLAKAGEPEAFSPTGRWLLTRGTDDAPRLWPLSAADPTAAPIELRAAGSLAAAAFRPDDRQLVTASYEGAARWWDLTAPDIDRTSRALPRRYGFSGGIVFNADGRWLLGFDPKGATLWEVQADVLAPEPVSLPTQDHPVSGASFTPDGRWLITRSHGSPSGDTVSLWPLRLADLTALACRTAGREFKTIEWKQYFPGQTPRKVCAPS